MYQFKNGAQAKKLSNGQYRIVKGASKQYMAKIRKQKGGSSSKLAKSPKSSKSPKSPKSPKSLKSKSPTKIDKLIRKINYQINKKIPDFYDSWYDQLEDIKQIKNPKNKLIALQQLHSDILYDLQKSKQRNKTKKKRSRWGFSSYQGW